MKKTLLCFLLLFTSFIYSQANDIVHCAGDNNFDLSKQKTLLIGNLDPDQTNVSYHLSLVDAVNNTNAIANPSNYNTAAVSTTIYARIDNKGTITTSSFNIKVTPALTIKATNTSILCSGDNTAELTVTVSGGSGQYFYSLNGGTFVSNNVFKNLAAGNHSIKVLDAVSGCPTTIIYAITAPTILSATTLISGNTATITATGGNAPYQYSLDGVSYQSNNIFTLNPGTYTLMVRDSLGCITTIQATILPTLTVSSIFVTEFSCSMDMLTMAITATGGKAPYTYSLDGKPYQTNNSYSGIFAGNHIISVKDASSTINSKGIFIAPYLPLKLSLSTTNTSCYVTNDGKAEIIVSDGKAPYLYSLDNGPFVSNNIFANLSPGYHTATVKDATGCTIKSDVVIEMTSIVEILESVTNAGLDNNDGQIKINASGGKAPYSYTLVDNVGTTIKGPQTSNIFSGLSAGTYQAQVTDSNGCFYTRSTIKVVQSTLAANVAVNAITCENPKGSITITATGGVPPYRYSLNDGAYSSVNVFNDLTPQTYTVKVRDAQNVRISLSAIVTRSTPLTLSTKVSTAIFCNGASTGSILSTPSGGKSPYTYSLDGITFQSSRYFLDLKAGTYNITAKDANNCIAVSSITLSEPSPLSATYEVVNDQNIFIYPKGGSNLYTFYLTNTTTGVQYGPETVGAFTKVPPGLYTIYVGDSDCDFTITGIKIEASQSTTLSAVSTVDPPGCLSFARITVAAMGGKTPYQYSINNGATYSSSNIFTSLNAGTYTVKVKDADLNTTTHTVVINPVPSAPTIEAIVKNITCQGSKNGSITVKGIGGSGRYLYKINGGIQQNFDTFSNLAPGNYIIEVQDMNICTSTMTVTVTEPQALNVTAKIGLNQTITATATGGSAPYSYALENDNGVVIAAPQSSNVFSNLANGLYTVKVIDANACSISVSNINVIPFTTLSASVTATNITCSSPTGTIKINATDGIQPYQYSLDNGAYVSSNVFENLTAKNYSIKVKDAQNTVLDLTTTVAQTTLLTVSANIETGINCPGNATGLIKATANGGAEPYQYSIDGTNFKSNRYFQNLSAGTYNITVKDNNGCLATTSTLILTEPSPISGTYKIVNEENIVLNGSGGDSNLYTYYLENTVTGTKLGPDTTGRFTKLAVGTYNATINNSNGCSFQIPGIKIETPTSTNLTVATFSDPVTCTFKGRITILAKGGKAPYQYSLNNGETYSSSNIIVGLTPNYAYPIVVRDADLNTVTDQIIVENASSPPFSTAIVKNVSCPGNNDGIIKVIPTYEKGALSYSLNGGTVGNSDTFENLKPGIYGITVYNQNSCWYYFTATVKEAIALTATVTIGTNNSITATVTGGTAPYSYALENENGVTVATPQSSSTFTNLIAGHYTLKVIDANTCSVTVSNINIIEVPKLAATATITNVNCNASGSITINATGGTGTYQYSIDGGINYSSSNIFTGLIAGNYIAKIKDSQNTVFSLSLEITAATPLKLTATLTTLQTCSSPATIQATVTGGLAPYTYAVNGGIYSASNTFNVNGGTHVISVKDSNGCVENISITVTDPTPIIANISIENQTATITASGGTGIYLYAISPNLNVFSASNKFTNLTAGEYIIIVQDQIGCYVTFNFTINPPAPSLEGKNSITISFKPGQTLADVVVEGDNIKWYSTSGSGTGKATGKANEIPLPLTTALLDGVTYYASQTINGIESKDRLAVTAKLNGALATPDFNLTSFQFYPNPVKDILTIKNDSAIDEVQIIDASGKSVLFKKINDLHSEIDLSNLSSGVYILKVKAENKQKTLKFVKK